MKKTNALFLSAVLIFSVCFIPADAPLKAAAKKPKLNVKKLTITTGANYRLRVYNLKKNQKVTYSSSKANIVSLEKVSAKQVTIKALSVGTSDITALIRKGNRIVRTLKCKVKVCPSAIAVKFMKRQISMEVDSRQRLETIVKPNSSLEQPVYTSSNPDIATVNSRGVVTALSPGTVTITATLLSCHASATCTITIAESRPAEHYKSRTPQSVAVRDFIHDNRNLAKPICTVLIFNKFTLHANRKLVNNRCVNFFGFC